jgi:biotin carboxyl carrier protein
MENEIKSGMDGKVKSIQVKEGDALDSGVLMIELEE